MTFAPKEYQAIGTISQINSNSIIHEVLNDGDHQYFHVTESALNNMPVVLDSTEIEVTLTSSQFDYTQFDKSFINISAEVNLGVSITGAGSAAMTGDALELAKALKYAICAKNSSDLIKSYSLYHKGSQVTGTQQMAASAESFIYHTYREETAKENKMNIHSRWKAVHNCETPSVCGTYVTLEQLFAAHASNGTITVPLNIIIPFTNIQLLQGFQHYPNSLFGQLTLRFVFNKDALVFKQCDPVASIKRYIADNALVGDSSQATLLEMLEEQMRHFPVVGRYNYEYEQIGNPSDIIGKIDKVGTSTQALTVGVFPLTLTAKSFKITACETDLEGYRQERVALEEERVKYMNESWVRFAQKVHQVPFKQSAGASSMNLTENTSLNNTTDFVFTFPRHVNETTISKNPMMKGMYMYVLGRQYPPATLNTTSAAFAAMMLGASDLEEGNADEEYANSLLVPRANSDNIIKPLTDLTSFLTTIKVERPSAMGLIFDGLDTKGSQTSIKLYGNPIIEGQYNDYYPEGGDQPPPPIMYTINDSFFMFNSRNGGQCLYSDRDFNEIQQRFLAERSR